MPEGASPDGVSELLAFTNPEGAPVKRTEASFQGLFGRVLRQGDWLYIPAQGSAGYTVPIPEKPRWGVYANLGLTNSDITAEGKLKPNAPTAQLYNLKDDLPQHTNVIAQHADIAERMQSRIDELRNKLYIQKVLELQAQKAPPDQVK
jgi:arylsulfatase A-like enzyme